MSLLPKIFNASQLSACRDILRVRLKLDIESEEHRYSCSKFCDIFRLFKKCRLIISMLLGFIVHQHTRWQNVSEYFG